MSIAHDNVKARYQQMTLQRAEALETARKKVYAAVPKMVD